MSETVLVTGGAGFIGNRVCRVLAEAGHRVTAFDIDGDALDRVDPRVSKIQGDVLNFSQIAQALAGNTRVIHLAAHAHVRWCEEHAAEACRLNIGGCRSVAEAMYTGCVSRVIYANSCAALYPQSIYGYTKRAGYFELLCQGDYLDCEIIDFQLANVYGPGSDQRRIIPTLIAAAQQGRTPTLAADGKVTRDYIHLQDVALAFVRAVEAPLGTNYMDMCHYYIGTGRKTSLRELWNIISPGSPYISGAALSYEPISSDGSPSLASVVFDWQPKVRLEDALRSLCQEHLLT